MEAYHYLVVNDARREYIDPMDLGDELWLGDVGRNDTKSYLAVALLLGARDEHPLIGTWRDDVVRLVDLDSETPGFAQVRTSYANISTATLAMLNDRGGRITVPRGVTDLVDEEVFKNIPARLRDDDVQIRGLTLRSNGTPSWDSTTGYAIGESIGNFSIFHICETSNGRRLSVVGNVIGNQGSAFVTRSPVACLDDGTWICGDAHLVIDVVPAGFKARRIGVPTKSEIGLMNALAARACARARSIDAYAFRSWANARGVANEEILYDFPAPCAREALLVAGVHATFSEPVRSDAGARTYWRASARFTCGDREMLKLVIARDIAGVSDPAAIATSDLKPSLQADSGQVLSLAVADTSAPWKTLLDEDSYRRLEAAIAIDQGFRRGDMTLGIAR